MIRKLMVWSTHTYSKINVFKYLPKNFTKLF